MRSSGACSLCVLVFLILQAVAFGGPATAAAAGSVYTSLERFVGSGTGSSSIFGTSVDIDGDTVVVGDSGDNAAFVFTIDGDGNLVQQQRIQPADVVSTDGFGSAVAISGDVIVVGSLLTNGGNGGAYVYSRSGGVWSQVAKLGAAAGNYTDNFGFAVDVAGDFVVVGAPNFDSGGSGEQGAAYAFTRTARSQQKATWTYSEQLLQGSDTDEFDNFGKAVATDGTRIIVGSPFDDTSTGSAYVFTVGTWTQEAKLRGADTATSDEFGTSVDIDGGLAIDHHGVVGLIHQPDLAGDLVFDLVDLDPEHAHRVEDRVVAGGRAAVIVRGVGAEFGEQGRERLGAFGRREGFAGDDRGAVAGQRAAGHDQLVAGRADEDAGR